MINAFAARASLAIALGLVLSGCVSTPVITTAPEAAVLKKRFSEQLRDLEHATGKRYKGKTIHINAPVNAIYRDWRMMPVAKIRGRRQGGLTSWRSSVGHTTITVAQWRGQTPEWLIRHEALHTVLLSHGITGHPSRYASLFGKSYWWMPEAYYRDKVRAGEGEKKSSSRPLLRTVFNRSRSKGDEILAGCCPICGIDYSLLAGELPTSD